jgi:hypothetical protein
LAVVACSSSYINSKNIAFSISIYNITKIINPIILTIVRMKNPILIGKIKEKYILFRIQCCCNPK